MKWSQLHLLCIECADCLPVFAKGRGAPPTHNVSKNYFPS